jgi:hypothetical protein
MPQLRKKPPAHPGEGELRYRGFVGQVRYEIQGDPATLRAGAARMRGSLSASPEVAAEAFREGDGLITLESGVQYRIVMLGHSTGSDTAYFEMRL